MSLLRKIRRHKAFSLRRLAQSKGIGGDGAASVCSLEDGDEDDEDADSIVVAGQTLEPNSHASNSAPPIHVETPAVSDLAEQKDVALQSIISIPSYATTNGDAEVDFFARESRLWPWIAKTAFFLLVSLGATYIGKVAALGITLCLAVACKLLVRDPIGDNRRSADCAESGQAGSGTDESIPLIREVKFPNGDKVALYKDPCLRNFPVHVLNNGAEKDLDFNYHGQCQEVNPSTKADADIDLLAKRKQLKRLNCLKLPPSASPGGECMEQSTSAKASPRTWFRNAGAMVAQSSKIESPEGMRKHGKFKSKILFRHLKKGEPQSVPSSPLCSDARAFLGSSDVVSDVQCAGVRTKSKFRPVSPISVADANMRLLDEQRSVESLSSRRGERKQTTAVDLDTSSRKETGKADGCPAVICKGGVKLHNINGCVSENGSECITSSTPTLASGEAITKAGMPISLVNDQGLQHGKQRRHQSPWKYVSSPVSLQTSGSGEAAALENQGVVRPARTKRGEEQQYRVGKAWLTSGIAVVTACLMMGKILAVAGLVCYWYALSLRRRVSRKA